MTTTMKLHSDGTRYSRADLEQTVTLGQVLDALAGLDGEVLDAIVGALEDWTDDEGVNATPFMQQVRADVPDAIRSAALAAFH